MLLGILLAVLMVVCVALVGVILLQRSEGGAFGMSSGGPGAFMTARGTGDFLTRTTEILVAVFFLLCLGMTIISSHERNASGLVQKLNNLPALSTAPAAPVSPAPAEPFAAPAAGTPNGAAPASSSPLNLLGNTGPTHPARPERPAPQAFGAPSQPFGVVAPPANETAKPPPTRSAGAASAASPAPAPAPAVQPAPVRLPPPAPAAPGNQ